MARKRLIYISMVLTVLTGAGTPLWGQPAGFAYVANCGGECEAGTGLGTVSVYTIDGTTGRLTPVPGSPFLAGMAPQSVTVDPTGHFVYVANEDSDSLGTVSAYSIDRTTGALTPVPGSPFGAGFGPSSVTVDPTGHFAYVTNFNSNAVSAYTIDSTTGALTEVPGFFFPSGSYPLSVTVDPTGSFAYVANCGSDCFRGGTGGNVSAYTIDGTTGALTPVPGSPFPAGSRPESVTVDPTGSFAYVANCGSDCFRGGPGGNVSAYTIDGTTGALTPVAGSPFVAGLAPFSVTVDPTGPFAYVANLGSHNVSAYMIDETTGALAAVPGSPFQTAGLFPFSVTVDPAGQFVYVANCGEGCGPGSVSAYRIDRTTGALTPVAGNPFPAGSFPISVTTTAGQPRSRGKPTAPTGGSAPRTKLRGARNTPTFEQPRPSRRVVRGKGAAPPGSARRRWPSGASKT